MKNYRTISNFKNVVRLVCRQLTTFLERTNIIPKEQTAYRRGHSTETAVLKLISDFYSAADKGEVSLLDFSICRQRLTRLIIRSLSIAYKMLSGRQSNSCYCSDL